MDDKFVRGKVEFVDLLFALHTGYGRQEGHMELFRVSGGIGRKGVIPADLFHFSQGPDHYRDGKSKALQNFSGNKPRKIIRVRVFSVKGDIAALDVGRDAGEVQPRKDPFQFIHFDHIMTADIDAAQQGYIGFNL